MKSIGRRVVRLVFIHTSFVWLIDQSAGAPAIFDNAMKYGNLGILYQCP